MIIKLIKDNKIDKAQEDLLKYIENNSSSQNSNLRNTVIVNRSRYKNNESSNLSQLITYQEYNICRNQIINELIAINNELFKQKTIRIKSDEELNSKEALEIATLYLNKLRLKVGIDEIKSGTSKFSKKQYFNFLLGGDKKGIISVYGNGRFQNTPFHVRKGIGYYYRRKFEFVNENLGLPISDEYVVRGTTNSRNDFENGYIDWIEAENKLFIYKFTSAGTLPIDEHQFGRKKKVAPNKT